MSNSHNIGLDALAGSRAILIQVKDVQALVRDKGGALGDLAQRIAPDTIAGKVYSEMAAKFAEGLKAEGVNADVKVVSPVGYQPAGVNPVWKPVAIAGMSLLGGVALWKVTAMIVHRIKSRRAA